MYCTHHHPERFRKLLVKAKKTSKPPLIDKVEIISRIKYLQLFPGKHFVFSNKDQEELGTIKKAITEDNEIYKK